MTHEQTPITPGANDAHALPLANIDDTTGYAAGAPLRAPLFVPGFAPGPGDLNGDGDPLQAARHTIIRSKSNITNN